MQAGMPWDWVTFPEFLDSVERTPKAVNILPYVPVGPMLIWVLGFDDAKAGRRPTDAEHAECAVCCTRRWMPVAAAGRRSGYCRRAPQARAARLRRFADADRRDARQHLPGARACAS